MVKIRWTREAVADLESIFKYITRDSVHYARLQVEILCESVGKLGIYPRFGRRLPEFPHLVHREIIVGSYRIIYRYDAERKAIHIVAIVHGRRLLKKSSHFRQSKEI
jgi:addiction module RelE/StbE family toxin